MNCNKVKEMKITTDDIVKAVVDSDQVEASADNKKIRRKENKALPEKSATRLKKREAKAGEKEEAKVAK